MNHNILSIALPLPINIRMVNCYLVKSDAGFFLIDTGHGNQRAQLERTLRNNGVQPGNLKLIIITHGDFDHLGNAAYLRQKFGSRIAMHADDVGMAEKGDMFWNRKLPNLLAKTLLGLAFGLSKMDRFKPDILLKDSQDLVEYGWDATVHSIPGHSRGSIAILTRSGELFCGDLLENTRGPAINGIMDDLPTARESVEKLSMLDVRMVFPGHGDAFEMDVFMKQIH